MIRPQRALPDSQSTLPRQINIVFESRWLHGLTAQERLRALTHLTNLLLLAAGLAVEEHSHESR